MENDELKFLGDSLQALQTIAVEMGHDAEHRGHREAVAVLGGLARHLGTLMSFVLCIRREWARDTAGRKREP